MTVPKHYNPTSIRNLHQARAIIKTLVETVNAQEELINELKKGIPLRKLVGASVSSFVPNEVESDRKTEVPETPA